jgi:hypothetical protein
MDARHQHEGRKGQKHVINSCRCEKILFDLFEFKRFEDGFDFFHDSKA